MAKSIKLTNNLIPITHSELVALRDSGELYPGATYRITDYECSSSDTDTAVASNKFDILVKAIDTNKLSEHCGALRHSSDPYFPGVTNFDAWEVWYCLDNDATRFGWASSNGKGVIYRLIDEFGNDCPYDFKNIKFKRTVSWFSSYNDWCTSCLGGVPTSDHLYFTFSLIDDTDSDGRDLSTNYYNGQKKFKFYQNKIAPYYNSNSIQQLNSILFILSSIDRGSCHSNTFGNGCRSNTFGSGCHSNTFGNGCHSNTFGNDCNSNTFENSCYSNTFESNCDSNTFGNSCYDNTFGNNCDSNTFGNSCYDNTFGNDCDYNIFGNSCHSNTFGNSCHSNTFGNSCHSNTFGNGCHSNTFGNSCYDNTFGNGCHSNTFGNDCNSNTFEINCDSNTFGNNCDSNTFGNGYSSNTFGNICSNNKFGDGCYSNTFGNDCNSNTFENSCYSNTFESNCDSNTFGNSCHSNTFGNNCDSNTFGFNCDSNTFGNNCDSNTFGKSNTDLQHYCRYNCLEDGVQNIYFYTTQTTSSSIYLQNITICRGVKGTSSSNRITIAVTEVNKSFNRKYGNSTSGTLVNWVG